MREEELREKRFGRKQEEKDEERKRLIEAKLISEFLIDLKDIKDSNIVQSYWKALFKIDEIAEKWRNRK
jgi:hypothetical protein